MSFCLLFHLIYCTDVVCDQLHGITCTCNYFWRESDIICFWRYVYNTYVCIYEQQYVCMRYICMCVCLYVSRFIDGLWLWWRRIKTETYYNFLAQGWYFCSVYIYTIYLLFFCLCYLSIYLSKCIYLTIYRLLKKLNQLSDFNKNQWA